jgi:integrase
LAEKLRGRLAAIFKSAVILKHHPGPNPAELDLVHAQLDIPKDAPQVENMAALPYHDVPDFIAELRGSNDQIVRSRALEFIILTGARIGEVLDSDRKQGMRWSTGEVDFDAKVWTVPKDRMKKKKVHPVPLSDRAIAILREMETLRTDDRVFPMTSSNVAKWITKRFKGAATVHGFRSSFRDWGDEAMHPEKLLEYALSHYTFREDGNATDIKTVQSYRHTTLLEQRRSIMQAWTEFCDGRAAAPVQKAA